MHTARHVTQSCHAVMSRNVWWVNQGLTYEQERAGGFLWAPLRGKSGQTFHHWDTLAEVKADDVIVHYNRGAVVALSRAIADGQPSPRPQGFEDAGSEPDGRIVRAEYFVLRHPIPRDRVASQIRAHNIRLGPITKTNVVKQGYLWRFSPAGLRILRETSPEEWPDWAEDWPEWGTSAPMLSRQTGSRAVPLAMSHHLPGDHS